ncbi:MAG: tRNA (adenosine(37)-N6)-threonylcarbamoyltransferase complex transferase subunit TsaD [Planctomycetota bacterium]|nr:tRNA (adenosine(37)-N6)-threonylcarbamoyltransferase complex transferase subunit TsaD [Planctomycetota bacterium]
MNEPRQPTCILAIESSCDETAAAVVRDGRRVASNVIASQHELHEAYGGVVPEIASRAHLERIGPIVDRALLEAGIDLEDLDAVAAGVRPGLIGSLLVGVSFAKALAWSRGLPFLGVDHVESHLLAGLIDRPEVAWPAVGLVVSGGHTCLYELSGPLDLRLLGATIDDAAGEAFDKAATMLGLPYPGGPELDRLAEDSGAEPEVELPISLMRRDSLDFSFSGVKTAMLYAIRGTPRREGGRTVFERSGEDLAPERRAVLAASFRHAVVAALVRKTTLALETTGARTLLAGGGVVANRLLRRELEALAVARGLELRMPEMAYCMDNAAMLGVTAHERLVRGQRDPLETTASPTTRRAR